MRWRFPREPYHGHTGLRLPHYDAQYLGYYLDVLQAAGETVVRDLEVNWLNRQGGGFNFEVEGLSGFLDFSDNPGVFGLDGSPPIPVKEVLECDIYFKGSMLKTDAVFPNVFPVGPTLGGRPGGAFGAGKKHERLLYWATYKKTRWMPCDQSINNILFGYVACMKNGEGACGPRRNAFYREIRKAGIPFDGEWVEPLEFWGKSVRSAAILDAVGSRPSTIGRKLIEGFGLGCVVMSNAALDKVYLPRFRTITDEVILKIEDDTKVGEIWADFIKDTPRQHQIREAAMALFDDCLAPERIGSWMADCANSVKLGKPLCPSIQ